jgi:phenylalanyl-tRNA synthetase beta chain
MVSGNKQESNWLIKEEKTNFYYLKTISENILKKIGISFSKITLNETDNHPDFEYAIEYSYKKENILTIGKIKKSVCMSFDIQSDVYCSDFDWNRIFNLAHYSKIEFIELSRFPEVRRDFALVVDKKLKFEEIRKTAFDCEKEYLKRVSLFDVYEGEKIGNDNKSYAVSFILRDDQKTLTDENIDSIMKKLLNSFEKNFGAKLR